MTRSRWFCLLGLGFAVAGADKILGQKGYRRMFRGLDWSEQEMRAIGTAELVGGLLTMCPAMRRFGGAVLAATSAVVLKSEIEHERGWLAAPRATLLASALSAVLL